MLINYIFYYWDGQGKHTRSFCLSMLEEWVNEPSKSPESLEQERGTLNEKKSRLTTIVSRPTE